MPDDVTVCPYCGYNVPAPTHMRFDHNMVIGIIVGTVMLIVGLLYFHLR
jgi:hypothetical protein